MRSHRRCYLAGAVLSLPADQCVIAQHARGIQAGTAVASMATGQTRLIAIAGSAGQALTEVGAAVGAAELRARAA